MVLLQIHSKLNVCNFVGMHSDLTFFIVHYLGGYFFPDTVYSADVLVASEAHHEGLACCARTYLHRRPDGRQHSVLSSADKWLLLTRRTELHSYSIFMKIIPHAALANPPEYKSIEILWPWLSVQHHWRWLEVKIGNGKSTVRTVHRLCVLKSHSATLCVWWLCLDLNKS